MKTRITVPFLLLISALITGCGDSSSPGIFPGPNNNENQDWLIPVSQVFDGGPGKDGIPSIDNPRFSPVGEIDFLGDEDLVVLVEVEGTVRGYPHAVLDWHEIVNDRPGLKALAITYCPLTGTAVAWDRRINNVETTFGVSGLLYNTNLMPYDRETESTWSQIRQDCVNGELISTKAVQYPVTELPWGLVKTQMPDVMILNTDTGFSRDYRRYPYGDYKTNNNRLLFPVSEEDNSLPQKERVLAIINGDYAKAYPFSFFPGQGKLVTDVVRGKEILVAGSDSMNYLVALEKPPGKNFSFLVDEFPFILIDDMGIKYDIFGNSGNGMDNLSEVNAIIGYWFTFPAFFEEVDIYE